MFFKSKSNGPKSRSRQGGNFSYFIYGVVICAVVLGCMGLPAIAKNFRSDYDKLQTDYNVLQNNMKTELENKTATIDRLTQENEDFRSKLHTADNQELQQRVKLLSDIKNYYDEGSVEEAAEKLINLSTAGFNQEVLSQYSSLCKTVLSAAVNILVMVKGQVIMVTILVLKIILIKLLSVLVRVMKLDIALCTSWAK